MYIGALHSGIEFETIHSEIGMEVMDEYPSLINKLHSEVAKFLQTKSENISLTHNTAEGLCLVAESYPIKPGDEIISYKCEYPSNHYPWILQERRGAKVILLENVDLSVDKCLEKNSKNPKSITPCAWSFEELEKKITSKTKIIALSHVQFTSGYAADLERLGKLCKDKNIDLIIDAAQSFGAIPIYPERDNIAAISTSTWKWLMGPIGSGLLYTSPSIREKLSYNMAGADLMQQGDDYLNHKWLPFTDGRRFEYSTVNYTAAVQLLTCFEEIFNNYQIEDIQKEIFELQNLFLRNINLSKLKPIIFPDKNRSSILSFVLDNNNDVNELVTKALKKNLRISTRGSYLRTGIHYYNSKDEILKAAEIINELV